MSWYPNEKTLLAIYDLFELSKQTNTESQQKVLEILQMLKEEITDLHYYLLYILLGDEQEPRNTKPEHKKEKEQITNYYKKCSGLLLKNMLILDDKDSVSEVLHPLFEGLLHHNCITRNYCSILISHLVINSTCVNCVKSFESIKLLMEKYADENESLISITKCLFYLLESFVINFERITFRFIDCYGLVLGYLLDLSICEDGRLRGLSIRCFLQILYFMPECVHDELEAIKNNFQILFENETNTKVKTCLIELVLQITELHFGLFQDFIQELATKWIFKETIQTSSRELLKYCFEFWNIILLKGDKNFLNLFLSNENLEAIIPILINSIERNISFNHNESIVLFTPLNNDIYWDLNNLSIVALSQFIKALTTKVFNIVSPIIEHFFKGFQLDEINVSKEFENNKNRNNNQSKDPNYKMKNFDHELNDIKLNGKITNQFHHNINQILITIGIVIENCNSELMENLQAIIDLLFELISNPKIDDFIFVKIIWIFEHIIPSIFKFEKHLYQSPIIECALFSILQSSKLIIQMSGCKLLNEILKIKNKSIGRLILFHQSTTFNKSLIKELILMMQKSIRVNDNSSNNIFFLKMLCLLISGLIEEIPNLYLINGDELICLIKFLSDNWDDLILLQVENISYWMDLFGKLIIGFSPDSLQVALQIFDKTILLIITQLTKENKNSKFINSKKTLNEIIDSYIDVDTEIDTGSIDDLELIHDSVEFLILLFENFKGQMFQIINDSCFLEIIILYLLNDNINDNIKCSICFFIVQLLKYDYKILENHQKKIIDRLLQFLQEDLKIELFQSSSFALTYFIESKVEIIMGYHETILNICSLILNNDESNIYILESVAELITRIIISDIPMFMIFFEKIFYKWLLIIIKIEAEIEKELSYDAILLIIQNEDFKLLNYFNEICFAFFSLNLPQSNVHKKFIQILKKIKINYHENWSHVCSQLPKNINLFLLGLGIN
ncbi:hypothetical protein M0812_24821 [Anaeramoeba flamelloides]|uniref:Uncharacterized protein n=1 Tax=Anaeramoeba flamelloides TaxID=1746091 RepID=A0AAV7YL96_9EUKA|nr:hypothetical protein M0812_24821 [Anaeramoeba flamelloides]